MRPKRAKPSQAGRSARGRENDMPLSEAGFCAVDLETTGLSAFSRIVEVGAVRFKVGEEGEQFQTLVDPGCSIPPGAKRVHGITDEMVAGSPRAREVLEQLFEFASGSTLVAHNARYDTSILTTELVRAGMDLPPNDVLCTIRVSKRYLPRMPNYRLQTVTSVLAIDPGEHHRALSDAVAAKQIFERAVTAEPAWTERNLSHLLEQCSSGRLGTNIEMDAQVSPELEELRGSINDAIDCGARMTILYGAGAKGPWPTQVKPLCVFSVKSGHYLEAACRDGYTRSYRLDRIVRIISIELGE